MALSEKYRPPLVPHQFWGNNYFLFMEFLGCENSIVSSNWLQWHNCFMYAINDIYTQWCTIPASLKFVGVACAKVDIWLSDFPAPFGVILSISLLQSSSLTHTSNMTYLCQLCHHIPLNGLVSFNTFLTSAGMPVVLLFLIIPTFFQIFKFSWKILTFDDFFKIFLKYPYFLSFPLPEGGKSHLSSCRFKIFLGEDPQTPVFGTPTARRRHLWRRKRNPPVTNHATPLMCDALGSLWHHLYDPTVTGTIFTTCRLVIVAKKVRDHLISIVVQRFVWTAIRKKSSFFLILMEKFLKKS